MTRPFSLGPILTRERLAAILVSLCPLLYFSRAVVGDLVLAQHDGLIQNVPFRAAAAQMIRNGFLPLWDPFIFSGMPFHAAMQAGVLFPLNWWFLVFDSSVAANLMTLTTYSLAALGAYLYARRVNSTISGSVVTSLVWQFSGFMVGQISHINIVQTAAMLPWVLWAIEGFAVSGKRKWGVLTAVFVALQVFVGHPQTLVYSLILFAAYIISMALIQRDLSVRYLKSTVFLIAGVAFAAVQIVPTFELLRNSIRSDATYEFFTSFSLPRRFIQTFFAPYILGSGDGRLFRAPYIGAPYYGEFIAYVGLLTLMLAICAILFGRDKRTAFWAIVAVVCFALALGDYAPLNLYHLLYFVPVVNLFRVPARHMMEVDFALAVLAGRGLTALGIVKFGKREKRLIAATGGLVLVLTCLTVTLFRPEAFRLARVAPVTILRAPELFIPIFVACLCCAALWMTARTNRRGGVAFLIGVLVFDLALWGQFSGWAQSPTRSDEVWHSPNAVKALREIAPNEPSSYRILTAPHDFDLSVAPVPPSVSHSPEWTLWTQPDMYMTHGFHNAAGYDGFGLERYSRLAGEMKVWGELTDPDRTLRGDSREIDILNVRYLLSMRKGSTTSNDGVANAFGAATLQYGAARFAASDIGLPNIKPGATVEFTVPPVDADMVALVTNLSWSEGLADGTEVGRVRVFTVDGRSFEFQLKAGIDTSEWSHDREDISARIRHKRATVALSYPVDDTQGPYQAHTFVTTFELPERLQIARLEITGEPAAGAPDLLLTLFKVSLGDKTRQSFVPLNREMVTNRANGRVNKAGDRWRLVTHTNDTDIFENTRLLPRAWLASEIVSLDESQTLDTVRTGAFSNGSNWDPSRVALVEPTAQVVMPDKGSGGSAEIKRYEPNRIELTTNATASSILVLSENHYPGWKAYVDGQGTGVLRVNYNLRGVIVPAGTHQVTFIYSPKSFWIGLLVTVFVLLGLILWSLKLLPEKRLVKKWQRK